MKNSTPESPLPASAAQQRRRVSTAIRSRLLALTSPESPAPLTRRGWIVVALLAVIAGVPYLFSPLETDSALFLTSGRKILQGGIHYRDIVDIKPPAIYHLYAAEAALFGPTRGAVRGADYVLQLLSALLMILAVRRISRNDLFAAASGLVYLLLYFGQSFRNTAQCESYVALLAFPLLWLTLAGKSRRDYALAGFAAGILFLFKFTLGILLLLLPLGLFLRRNDLHGRFSRLLSAAAGFAGVALLFLLYLFFFHAWNDFRLMQQFIGTYAGLQWHSLSTTIQGIIGELPSYFGVHYSILFSALTLLGITASFGERKKVEENPNEQEIVEPEKPTEKRTMLLQCAVAGFFLLLFTIVLEGKYQGWYFNRLFGFGALLIAWGAIRTIRRAMQIRYTPYAVALFLLLVVVGVPFSTLPRYFYHSAASLIYRQKGEEALDRYYGYSEDPNERSIAELKEVGEYLRKNKGPGDHIFIASGAGGLIALYADYVPDFRIFHSGFLIAPYAPERWRKETQAYLLGSRPMFIVLNDDRMESITASKRSSREAIMALPGVAELLMRDYAPVKQTRSVTIYRRRAAVPAQSSR